MEAVKKERFLTLGWSNFLSLAGGFILLAYVVFILSTPVLTDRAAFIGLVVIGVVY
jgi:hypothetical protein